MTTVLLVGSSETAVFGKVREQLENKYILKIDIETKSGCNLGECYKLIKKIHKKKYDVVFIFALITEGWTKMKANYGRSTISVFGPTTLSLQNIPEIMNKISQEFCRVNPACEIYLVIPPLKDLFTFNQRRLERAWGPNSINILENHPVLNPISMREHSIKLYEEFSSLVNDEYQWMKKNIILANDSIKLYFSRNSKSRPYEILPHYNYKNKNSLKMNLPLIPDGLHENEDFAWYFFKANKRIFEKFGKQQVTYETSSVCDHVSFRSRSQGNHPYKWKDHPKTEHSRMEYEPQMPSTSRAVKFKSSSRNPHV
ncbi:UNVERIFIED_CONTAM: hypothetical protein RMT77_018712 [Armadillidium vulgare]